MKPLQLLLAAHLLVFSISANAQPDSDYEERMNMVKLNLPALVLKNFSLQYERVVTPKMSAAISIRYMPSSSIPFKNLIQNQVSDDADTDETIEKLRISNFAITPEFRFYLSKKGYGHGFYLAPFYRYASFKTNDLIFYYDDDFFTEQSISLSGKLNSHTGGLLIGAQWHLGSTVVLDWWILGPHYGSGTGDFTGLSSQPLSPSEQDRLREELEDLDIPLTNKTVSVNANGAALRLDGPWGGLRAGLSIGVRF